VVLWDVEHKRGWLVNGTSALLHLLRASLKLNETDGFQFAFLFKPERMNEATSLYTVTSAMEVLMDPTNLNLELYQEVGESESTITKSHYRLRDRVVLLYSVLEQLIDHQAAIAGLNNEGFKSIARRDLEGWDFKDIASNEDPLYPRATRLKTIGKGWVDFTRAIHAITLFGRGFGDIIQPVMKTCDSCTYWDTIPSGKYYLAASMADLSSIMDRFGHPRANPPRLTESLVWYPLKRVSNIECHCIEEGQTEHPDLAQVILPPHISRKPPKCGPLQPKDSGAVAFGYNKDFGWIWNDIGDPENGEQQFSDTESDDEVRDSGIGSSVMSPPRPSGYEPQIDFSTGSATETLTHEHYKIGIVCALPKELMAVRALFDDVHPNLPLDENDNNSYALGRMENQNVIAACLPHNDSGTNSAAKVASDMIRSFRGVRWYLVVGIGGGVPSVHKDIRLGDVVIGDGLIQYDMGKAVQNDSNFRRTEIIQRPAAALMALISEIRSDPHLPQNPLEGYIEDIVNLRPEYKRPAEEYDRLFEADWAHEADQETCEICNSPQVPRKSRHPGTMVHYGLIASGNQVIKDAKLRDRIGHDTNALCFEMEAAGVMETAPCLVIRGICNYADSHKNDLWQEYAAAAAAAYAKFFLSRMRHSEIFLRAQSPVENQRVTRLQKRTATFSTDHTYRSKRFRQD
jgi:nucleoside phosphorylase